MNQTVKDFLKPTKLNIIATILVIIALMIDQTLIIQSWPKETIFSTIYSIIFTPADLIKQTILGIIGANSHSPLNGPITFILDIITYYLLGCLVAYIINLYKKRAIKK